LEFLVSGSKNYYLYIFYKNMPRSRKNITRKRGGFWPFPSSSSTNPSTYSSSSNIASSWWNPFSENFAEKKNTTSSYMPSTSYAPAPSSSYTQGNQSMYASPSQPVYGGKRSKSKKVIYVQRSIRPSLSRTGGKKKRITRKRKH
jgi:hypothetical protein